MLSHHAGPDEENDRCYGNWKGHNVSKLLRAGTLPTDTNLRLERFLPAIITLISNRLVSTGTVTYGAAFDIGLMDVRVMTIIAAEPNISATRIVEAVGLNKGAVSRVLKSLVERELVVAAAPFDPRRHLYALTSKGRRISNAAIKVANMRHDVLLEGLSEEQVATLVELLNVLVKNTQKLKALADPKAHDALRRG